MIHLRPCEPPFDPEAVVATGSARPHLAEATARLVRAGRALRAAAGDGWLVVLGNAADLPWADGCRYLARDGPLLVPTTRRVVPSADLVAGALGVPGALIVVLEEVVLVGPTPLRIADPERVVA
jgi:hypothetical protein